MVKEILEKFSQEFHRSASEISFLLEQIQKNLEEEMSPDPVPGALDFINNVKKRGFRVLIMTKARKTNILRQLSHAGFQLEEKDISGGPGIQVHGYDRESHIQAVLDENGIKNCNLLYFDDWTDGIKAIKGVSGIFIGFIPDFQHFQELYVEWMVKKGASLIMKGWEKSNLLIQVLESVKLGIQPYQKQRPAEVSS